MEVRLKNVMSRVIRIPVETIDETTSNTTVEKWDSLAQMTLVLALEDEFDVEFEVAEIQALGSYVLLRDALIRLGAE